MDVSELVTKTVFNKRISKVLNKIPNVSGLVKRKQIMTPKYDTLNENISLLLNIFTTGTLDANIKEKN